jgi:hypothetical protein
VPNSGVEVVDHVLGRADHRGAFQLNLQVEVFSDHSFWLEWVHSEDGHDSQAWLSMHPWPPIATF